MNILLTFDSTSFINCLTPQDDPRMVDFIIREYGAALESAISKFAGDSYNFYITSHYHEAYFKTVLQTGNTFDHDPDLSPSFRKRVVDEDGNVTSSKERYDELVETCNEIFSSQCIAVLRGIQMQARRIYTVDVVGYENRTLKLLLKTDGAFQP